MNKKNIVITIVVLILALFGLRKIFNRKVNSTKVNVDVKVVKIDSDDKYILTKKDKDGKLVEIKIDDEHILTKYDKGVKLVEIKTSDEHILKKDDGEISTVIVDKKSKRLDADEAQSTYILSTNESKYIVVVYQNGILINATYQDFKVVVKYENKKYFHKIFKRGRLENFISQKEINIIKKYYAKNKFVIKQLDKFYTFIMTIDQTQEFKNKQFDLSKVEWIEGLNWKESLVN